MSTDPEPKRQEAPASRARTRRAAARGVAPTGRPAQTAVDRLGARPAQPPAPQPDLADDRPGREPGELVLAMSPRQIIGGFALIAALILMLRRRRRG